MSDEKHEPRHALPTVSGVSIILASTSPRRRWILSEMGVDFKVVPPDVEEETFADGDFTIRHLPLQNASLKSRAVAVDYPNALTLGADTIVGLDGDLLEKPRDMEEAVEMLLRLSGRWHEVVTGVCLTRLADDLTLSFAEISKVKFKRFDRDFAAEYAIRAKSLDKAGAYAIQDGGADIVETLEGSIFNVMGLPAERLAEAFQALDRVC